MPTIRNASQAGNAPPQMCLGRSTHLPFFLLRDLTLEPGDDPAPPANHKLDIYGALFDATHRAALVAGDVELPDLVQIPSSGHLLELSILWYSDGTDPSIDVAPEVRVWGIQKPPRSGPENQANPNTIFTGKAGAPSSDPLDKGWIVPLMTTASPSSALVTLSNVNAFLREDGDGRTWGITEPTHVYLAGAPAVAALLETPGTIDDDGNEGTEGAMLVARVIDA